MTPARRPFMILNRDSHGPANWTHPAVAAPEWTKDMVVYEIAPRGFTSPNGTVKKLHHLTPRPTQLISVAAIIRVAYLRAHDTSSNLNDILIYTRAPAVPDRAHSRPCSHASRTWPTSASRRYGWPAIARPTSTFSPSGPSTPPRGRTSSTRPWALCKISKH